MEQDYEMPSTGIDLGCKKLPLFQSELQLFYNRWSFSLNVGMFSHSTSSINFNGIFMSLWYCTHAKVL